MTTARGWALCLTTPGATGRFGRALLETADAGRRWTIVARVALVSPPRGFMSYGDPEGIRFLPDGRGWEWQGPRGVSIATTDGGRHWHPVGLGRAEADWVQSGWFVSPRVGYALVAYDGYRQFRLEATGIHGTTWRTVYRWRIR